MCPWSKLVLIYVLPSLVSGQVVSFRPPIQIAGGGASGVQECSTCVAVADFDGDGNLDIAYNVQTPLPNGGVRLGMGDGTFRTGPFFEPALGPIMVGDFNGDGKPDIFLAGSSAYVYLNTGGSFASRVEVSACDQTSGYVPVQVADFDRDGKTDLICGTLLLLSNGDGTFRPGAPITGQAMESVALVADFNGDGIPDVLMQQISGILAIMLGRGDGTFRPEQTSSYSVHPQTTWTFLTGDFNGDGKVDIVTFTYHGDRIDFLPGNGDGTFGAPVGTLIAPNPVPGTMTTAGDFNKDGKLDFIAGDAVFAGNGDGTFRFPVFFGPTPGLCGLTYAPGEQCTVAHSWTAVGDFNGDGLPDLTTYTTIHRPIFQNKDEGSVSVLLNDSPGDDFLTRGVSAATGTWPVAPGSIVTAYGLNLAPATASATTNPAPTTLGGIRVHVRDGTGDTLAPLLYVSPTQINYVLNAPFPWAWVDIERIGTQYVPQGMTVPIAELAPGFFAAPYTTNAPGYLSLYGTGFADASTAASACTVGNSAVPVTYAGPQIQMAGLDQVNLLLPPTLSGAGAQPVTCVFGTADQQYGSSNTVNVTIR